MPDRHRRGEAGDELRQGSATGTARRRRQRRAAVTLTLCVLLLLGALGYAVTYFQHWIGPEASAGPGCAAGSASANPLAPANIKVNVYNATKRPGLAGDTARTLRERGFDVATVSNDPLHQDVTGPAVICYGTTGAQEATKVVAKQVPGAKLVRDARTDSSVDLVIGATFTQLASAPQTPAPKETASSPSC